MSDLAKRICISVVSVAAVAIFLLATIAWALEGSCDNADYATLASVRCQGPFGGHSWMVGQGLLILLAAGAMLGGIGWAVWKARFLPLAASGAFSLASFGVVFLIGTIHIGPEPGPRLSAASVLNPICADHCAGGVRVSFTTERAASIFFDFYRNPYTGHEARRHDYIAGIVTRAGAAPQLAAVDFAAGAHVVDVALLERSPSTRRRRPLRPGPYSLEIQADLPSPSSILNQSGSSVTETRHFTVVSARQP